MKKTTVVNKMNELMETCMKINFETKMAAFFSIDGHVDWFTVYVSEGKDNGDYNKRMFHSGQVYYRPTMVDSDSFIDQCDKINKELLKILNKETDNE